MKIVSLPKGGQRGIHGPTICVPSDMGKIQSVCPRNIDDAKLVKIKLKRKLEYKGHYSYQTISLEKVKAALVRLKQDNDFYRDVAITTEWLESNECNELVGHENGEQQIATDDPEIVVDLHGQTNAHEQHCSEIDQEANIVPQMQSGENFDSFLQPTDISTLPETMQQSFEQIYSIAPCEGNKPVPFFKDNTSEQKAFPTLFPTGQYGLNVDRTRKISMAKYFNSRLLNADPRFASDPSYIFFGQYMSEHNQVASKLSITLRKGCPISQDGTSISKQLLASSANVNQLIKSDAAYRFMQPIRGTPSYWERTLRDLFATIRQIWIPTWFATFIAAELRWPEIITAISLQHRKIFDLDKLDWNQKCELLRLNPVTAARMFDDRVQI